MELLILSNKSDSLCCSTLAGRPDQTSMPVTSLTAKSQKLLRKATENFTRQNKCSFAKIQLYLEVKVKLQKTLNPKAIYWVSKTFPSVCENEIPACRPTFSDLKIGEKIYLCKNSPYNLFSFSLSGCSYFSIQELS